MNIDDALALTDAQRLRLCLELIDSAPGEGADKMLARKAASRAFGKGDELGVFTPERAERWRKWAVRESCREALELLMADDGEWTSNAGDRLIPAGTARSHRRRRQVARRLALQLREIDSKFGGLPTSEIEVELKDIARRNAFTRLTLNLGARVGFSTWTLNSIRRAEE